MLIPTPLILNSAKSAMFLKTPLFQHYFDDCSLSCWEISILTVLIPRTIETKSCCWDASKQHCNNHEIHYSKVICLCSAMKRVDTRYWPKLWFFPQRSYSENFIKNPSFFVLTLTMIKSNLMKNGENEFAFIAIGFCSSEFTTSTCIFCIVVNFGKVPQKRRY